MSFIYGLRNNKSLHSETESKYLDSKLILKRGEILPLLVDILSGSLCYTQPKTPGAFKVYTQVIISLQSSYRKVVTLAKAFL